MSLTKTYGTSLRQTGDCTCRVVWQLTSLTSPSSDPRHRSSAEAQASSSMLGGPPHLGHHPYVYAVGVNHDELRRIDRDTLVTLGGRRNPSTRVLGFSTHCDHGQ